MDEGAQRVRKQAGGVSTEYIHFNGEPVAEWNGSSDWSDYIYAEGKRIARADNYEDQLATQGTSCSNCTTYFRLRNGTGYLLRGYVIQTGDKLMVRQWQSSGVHGGVGLDFASGNTLTLGNMASDPNSNQWDYRSFDLSTVAGNTVTSAWVTTQSTPASGGWNINYQDFVLLSYDGTVHKLYSHDQSANLEISGTTGPTYSVTHVPNLGNVSGQTTTFYHGDHLGSSRLLSNANGYPTWQGTYYPYGMEYTPPGSTDNTATVNNYKFTGKERDAESGLDYFGARYYGSAIGRFLTPDWAAKAEPVPYAKLDNPQSLNLYAYVLNNPLSKTDPDGHEVDFDQNAKKGEKLLLKNVSKSERKMFEVTKNADGKSVLGLKAGAEDKFKGNHTEGYNRLTTAINSDKVETVNVAKNYTDAQGVSHNVSREYGGGVTVMYGNGNSTIYVSPSGNPGQLTGVNGQAISDPLSIIMGHETLGHGLENAIGGDRGQHRAIEIENILRGEQKQPQRAQDPQ